MTTSFLSLNVLNHLITHGIFIGTLNHAYNTTFAFTFINRLFLYLTNSINNIEASEPLTTDLKLQLSKVVHAPVSRRRSCCRRKRDQLCKLDFPRRHDIYF